MDTKVRKRIEANIPYTLLRLGLNCNARCLFCNVPPESFFLKEMTTREAKSQIDVLIAQEKRIRLDISGGEPTLRNDLEEIIAYAAQKGVKTVQIQTNAILCARREYVKRLKSSGLRKAFVSLHSPDPKVHDYLLGYQGAFVQSFKGIRCLIKAAIEVTLNVVVTSKNYRTLPEYVAFVHVKFPEIKSISLSVVQPRARAWVNNFLVPRYKHIGPYVSRALRLGEKFGIIINNPFCGLPLCIGGWQRRLKRCVEYSQNLLKQNQRSSPKADGYGKIKAPFCRMCALDAFCNGVWKEYAQLYSFSDLAPIGKKERVSLSYGE